MAKIPQAPTPATTFGGAVMMGIPLSFSLTDNEREAAAAWMAQHRHSQTGQCNPGSSGELFCFTFTPSGMGQFVKIACIRCGEEQHITDTENW